MSRLGDLALSRFVRALGEGLQVPRTATKILTLLARRGGLSVRQIALSVRASERSVRMNLALLLRKGVLAREVRVTRSKKLSYSYSLRSVDELLAAAEREIASTVTRLQIFAKKVASG